MAILQDASFWSAVAFVIFVIAVFKPIKGALTSGLDGKIDAIRSEVDEAKRLREEAQNILASYQRQQRDAAAEVEKLLERAKAEAETHRKAGEKALAETLRRQELQAAEKIAQAEAAAVRKVRELAVDIAVAATAKVLSDKLQGSEGDALIDTAISNLPERLH